MAHYFLFWLAITGIKITFATTNKISLELQSRLNSGQTPDIIVECSDGSSSSKSLLQSDNTAIPSILNELHSLQRQDDLAVTTLVNTLQAHMTQDMQSSIDLLTSKKVPFTLLWATEEIFVQQATPQLVSELAQVSDVKVIRSVGSFKKLTTVTINEAPGTGDHSWNLNLIKARCPNITCFGENVTIGFIDTGARSTHHEIQSNWSPSPYNWFDGTHSPPNCTAYDPDGHGTHVIGTACGRTLGVAPSAHWTMCMGCTSQNCSEAAVKLCGQWMLCPWLCSDSSPQKTSKNCKYRPDIISNSWGMTNQEQLVMPYNFYERLVTLWNAVGIISTFAIGNEGPFCTSGIPPGSYPHAFSVGAIDSQINLAWFSSVGPQLWKAPLNNLTLSKGSCSKHCDSDTGILCKIIKPDIVAPGWLVNSSFNGNDTDYKMLKGTSMATPHVAGVAALILCANRKNKWNYLNVYKLLTETANRQDIVLEGRGNGSRFGEDTNYLCNQILGEDLCGINRWPNNMYGWGLADACAAVEGAKMIK